MGKKDMIRSMYKEYGMVAPREDGSLPRCGMCCNYQISKLIVGDTLHVCVAYGDGAPGYRWDPLSFGCGIYNYAFCALRPKRRPLVEVKSRNKTAAIKATEDQEVIQTSLLFPEGGVIDDNS